MSKITPPRPENDDQLLDFNLKLRHDIVVKLTHSDDGSLNIPDEKMLTAVRGLLKDNDSSIYTKRRLTVDEAAAENDKRAAEILEKMLEKVPARRRDEQHLPTGRGPDLERGALPDYEILPGELSPVGDEVDLNAIMREGRRLTKGLEDED